MVMNFHVRKMTEIPAYSQQPALAGADEVLALFERYADPEAGRCLRENVLAQVVSWRWASGAMVQDEPFEYELNYRFLKAPRGRWLREDKAREQDHVRCGFDAAGRIVMASAYGSFQDIWLHGAGRITKLVFSLDQDAGSWKVHAAKLSLLDADGRLLAQYSRFRSAWQMLASAEFFRWDHGRVVGKQGVETDDGGAPCHYRYDYEVDGDGGLERISFCRTDAGGLALEKARTRYRRPVQGERIPELAAAITERLLSRIPELVRQAALDEPLYALLLCYTEEDFDAAWPPFLVWGRQSWRAEVTETPGYYLWAPDEIRAVGDAHERWLDDDETLTSLCLRHKALMADRGSQASGRKVLLEVARQLNLLDWSGITPVTDDFVVVLADNSGEVDPRPKMKAYLPPGRLALLRERGWLQC